MKLQSKNINSCLFKFANKIISKILLKLSIELPAIFAFAQKGNFPKLDHIIDQCHTVFEGGPYFYLWPQ